MYIIADIGGTNTRIARSPDLQSFGEPVIFDTPQEYDAALGKIAKAARECAHGEEIERAAFGLPVLLAQGKRVILHAKNLPQWTGNPFADDVERAIGGSVVLENDAAQVGLGEAVYGAGAGVRSIMYLTISTGVNAVHIVDGRIDPSSLGVSTGRQYVSMDDPLITWEDMVSGKAIADKYGVHPKELGKDWSGWEDIARVVAFGVHNSILHWTPERVVLGGSMFNEIGISIERVRFHLEAIKSRIPEEPEIVHSSLGDLGGLCGGMVRLRQQ